MPPPPASDACPGMLALHPARDGHVARIRLPGGYVTGARWRALAGAGRATSATATSTSPRAATCSCAACGPAHAAELADRAAGAGLLPSAAHDRARNITASPLAGLAGRPPLRPLVRALDAVLARAIRSSRRCRAGSCSSLDDGTGGAALAGCDVGLRWPGDAGGAGDRRAARRRARRRRSGAANTVVEVARGSSPRRPGRPSRGAWAATSAASPISRTAGQSVAAAHRRRARARRQRR